MPKEIYNDVEHLTIINHSGDIPVLSSSQAELHYNVEVPQSGRYIFVIDYVSERNYAEPNFIKLHLDGDDSDSGSATLYPCLYSMACRTPIIDDNSREKTFFINKGDNKPVVVSVSLKFFIDIKAAII